MSDNSSNNKRIAKNTIMLYVRMLLKIMVSFYTSRVVLQTLGVEDYGIYGIVGGIMALFGFVNITMTESICRFLTFEMGEAKTSAALDCNEDKLIQLKKIFTLARTIHLGISFLVLVFALTVGLWILNNKLIIPGNRMNAAYWTYICFTLSTAVKVTQVPYDALIIAREKMEVFASIEIFNVVLKLGVIYLLVIGNIDKLILYSCLSLGVSVVVAMVYRVYCLKHYEETHLHWEVDRSILKTMISFSGWNLFSNFCICINQQANNFFLNIFFGVILNASSTIATNVYGIVYGFGYNVIQAFCPQMIKAYASGNVNYMQYLLQNASRYSVVLIGFIMIPVIYEMPYLLNMWLGQTPPFVSIFCRIMMITTPIAMLSNTLMTCIHATGRIKYYNFLIGTCNLLNIPVAYFVLRLSGNEISTYIVTVGTTLFVLILNLIVLKHNIKLFSLLHYMFNVVITFVVIVIAGVVVFYIRSFFESSFTRLIIVGFSNTVILSILTVCYLLDKGTRNKLIRKATHT